MFTNLPFQITDRVRHKDSGLTGTIVRISRDVSAHPLNVIYWMAFDDEVRATAGYYRDYIEKLSPESVKLTKREFLVRQNCEYSIVVEAYTPEQAFDLASATLLEERDQAWSGLEVEDYGEQVQR